MSRDGSGSYSLAAGNPVITGTLISSTTFNTTMSDVATAMTQSIAKDGQTTPSANLPMGGNKHTGVADGTASNQYASVNQAQNGSLISVGSVANVGATAYTGSVSPAIASYTDGMMVTWTPNATSTGAATMALNGLAIKSIFKGANSATVAGDLVLNVKTAMIYSAAASGWLLIDAASLVSAAPTATTKLTATTGTSSNYMASDSAPALDVSIAPTWTGLHTFTPKVTIGPPASGKSLQVNMLDNIVGADFNTSTAVNGGFVSFSRAGTATGAVGFGPALFSGAALADFGIAVNAGVLRFSTDFGSTTRMLISAAGSVNIVAPTAAVPSLNVVAAANANVALLTGSTVTDQSFGPLIQAGTTSLDYALAVQNKASTSTYLLVRGDGLVRAVDQGGTIQDVGWRDTPQNNQSGSYQFVLGDRGKQVATTSSGITYTIPANTSVAFPVGTVIVIANNSGGSITIVITTDTLTFSGVGTTGSRTLASAGLATITKVSSTGWFITGAGLS